MGWRDKRDYAGIFIILGHMSQPVLILCGPTASGKSQLAMDVARHVQAHYGRSAVIINADSMQVYRELPILTAQPSKEDMEDVEHQLYGVLPASFAGNAGWWMEQAERLLAAALEQEKIPIIVGGTGLYISALTQGMASIPTITAELREEAKALLEKIGNDAFHIMLNERDPAMGKRVLPSDSQRLLRAWEVLEQTGKSLGEWQKHHRPPLLPPERYVPMFLNPDREWLYQRCNARFEVMLAQGALEEARALDAQALSEELPAMKALGVPELRQYLKGEISQEDAITQAQQSTRRYAKRQLTWFRNQMQNAEHITHLEEGLAERLAKKLGN